MNKELYPCIDVQRVDSLLACFFLAVPFSRGKPHGANSHEDLTVVSTLHASSDVTTELSWPSVWSHPRQLGSLPQKWGWRQVGASPFTPKILGIWTCDLMISLCVFTYFPNTFPKNCTISWFKSLTCSTANKICSTCSTVNKICCKIWKLLHYVLFTFHTASKPFRTKVVQFEDRTKSKT